MLSAFGYYIRSIWETMVKSMVGGAPGLHRYTRLIHVFAEQYVAAGRAARLATSLGLHREPTCQLRQVEDESLRTLFWTTYILEKTVSLWQGRPSSLNIREEIDTVLPKASDVGVDFPIALLQPLLIQASVSRRSR